MITRINKFCSSYSWAVIGLVLLITALAIQQIGTRLYFEGDLTKFLPKDLPTVKSDDFYQKNFNYQEQMIIGVEARRRTLLEPKTLRKIEEIVLKLKQLQLEKTFFSHLTGKDETIKQALGFDIEDIASIANLEDIILDQETGAVNTGSVVEKLKKTHGISFSKEQAERLPEQNEDLLKIIPGLRDRALNERLFVNSLLSEDFKKGTIQVPMIRKWDVKKSYVYRELSTAIDPVKLKQRFLGKDTFFPFEVLDKQINGVSYDSAFIHSHARQVRKKTHQWLTENLEGGFNEDPALRTLLSQELNPGRFEKLMNHLEGKDAFMNPDLFTWVTFFNKFYEYTLDVIDPLSRENLEFKLFDPVNIYNLASVYLSTLEVLEHYKDEDLDIYVAGQPVVFALMSLMMGKDMERMLPLAILVILIILGLSFRSTRGVIIPLLTVVFSTIWSLGAMAYLGVPLSISTSSLPIVLLAVGTAYGIHFLNAYYTAYAEYKDKRKANSEMASQVGVAVCMAAMTTMAGFGSLAFGSLATIAHFGIFSAFGVGCALLLTLTLTPALLAIWPAPRWGLNKTIGKDVKIGLLEKTLTKIALSVSKRPKTFLTVSTIVFVFGIYLTFQNHFEGSTLVNFRKSSEIYKSDNFLNKNLTGTTPLSFIMRFRDEVHLESEEARQIFSKRLRQFSDTLELMEKAVPEINGLPGMNFRNQIVTLAYSQITNESQNQIVSFIRLVEDIFNEDYQPELPESEESLEEEDNMDLDDALSWESESDNAHISEDIPASNDRENVSENEVFEELDEGVIAGLKDIHQRLGGAPEENWEKSALIILKIREMINHDDMIPLLKSFNQLNDFLDVTIKQPLVLAKLEKIYSELKALDDPVVEIDGTRLDIVGFVSTPVDSVRKLYRTFYHDDDYAYDRLPVADQDGFKDTALTDRSLTAVALNQAHSSDRDRFEASITPDKKEFNILMLIRNEKTATIIRVKDKVLDILNREFPADDPYIQSIWVGGQGPSSVEITNLITISQIQSIVMSFGLVLLVTFFIFRSLIGGVFSLIPLVLTVILDFSVIFFMGNAITVGNVIVASIAIGTGIDYTIHFLERYKKQIQLGDSYETAYLNTVRKVGRAIILNAFSVALGFLVLLFSEFVSNIDLGILMATTMIFSTFGALVILPSLILVTRPKFILSKKNKNLAFIKSPGFTQDTTAI